MYRSSLILVPSILINPALRKNISYLLLFSNPKTFSASQIFEGELSPPEICLRRAWQSPSTPGTEFFISSQESHSTCEGNDHIYLL